MVSVTIIGVPAIQNRLNTMTDKSKIEQALDHGAALVELDAKRLVRVDTGLLKNSINTVKKSLYRAIGSSKQYALAQEFGRPDLQGYGYTPYLRPAIRKNRAKIMKLVKEAIQK